MILKLTSFGALLLLILSDKNSAGTIVRHSPFEKLRYREIPIQEALRGMSRNARARQAKQTDLHSTVEDKLQFEYEDESTTPEMSSKLSIEAKEIIDTQDASTSEDAIASAKSDDEIDIIQVVLPSIQGDGIDLQNDLQPKTDEVRPKDVTISSKSDKELSTTIVQALLRSKKRDGIDLNNEHQGKTEVSSKINDNNEANTNNNNIPLEEIPSLKHHTDHPTESLNEGISIIHPNYNNIQTFTQGHHTGFTALTPVHLNSWDRKNFNQNFQSVALPSNGVNVYQPLVQTPLTVYPINPYQFAGRLQPPPYPNHDYPTTREESIPLTHENTHAVQEQKQLEINKGDAGKLALGIGALYLAHKYQQNKFQQQNYRPQSTYGSYYQPSYQGGYQGGFNSYGGGYNSGYNSGYGGGFGAGSFYGRIKPEITLPKTDEVVILDPYKDVLRQNVRTKRAANPQFRPWASSTTRVSTNPFGSVHPVETVDEDFTYYPDAGDHLRGSNRFDPRPSLDWSGIELFSPRRPALPSRFSHPTNRRSSTVTTASETFDYYRDDEPAPKWGTTEVIEEEAFAGPNAGRTTLKTFTPATPLYQEGRSPQVEVERVDEDFTYYRDDEPAPQWGTTEEISEEILAHNPERTFGNPVQSRRNTEDVEEVSEGFSRFPDDQDYQRRRNKNFKMPFGNKRSKRQTNSVKAIKSKQVLPDIPSDVTIAYAPIIPLERDGLDIAGQKRDSDTDTKKASSDKFSISPGLILGAGVGYLVYNQIKNQQQQNQRPPPGYGPPGYGYPGQFGPPPGYNPYNPNPGFGQPITYPSQTSFTSSSTSGSYPFSSSSFSSTDSFSTSYPSTTTTYYPSSFGRTAGEDTPKPIQYVPVVYTF